MSNKSTSWKSLKAWQETDYPISPFLALHCLWHKILPYKGFVSRQPLIDLINHCRSCAVNLRHQRIEAEDLKKGWAQFSTDLVAPFKFQLTVLRKPLVVVGWCLHHES